MKKSQVRGKGKAPGASFGIAVLLLFGGLLSSAGDLDAQRVVHILDEPRHRTMHTEGDVHLLDVQINPGDTTLMHTHDSPILYTFISSGTGSSNGRVQSITSYLEEPYTHQVNNQGPGLFRILALAHYGEGVDELEAGMPDGIRQEAELVNPWFRSYRFEMEPGEETDLHRHRHSTLVVQVTEGTTHVTREDGITAELARMGDWTWRTEESPYRVRNVGDSPVSIVVNEVRRAP